MEKLDLKDRKLLYWLDQDSRATNKSLGKKVGLTEQAIGYRLKKLQERGIVKKCVTFINTISLGYSHYRVFLKLYNLDQESEKAIIQSLINNPNIRWIASVSGKYDLSFSILAKSPLDFLNTYSQIEKEHGKHMIEKNILINVRSPGFSRDHLLGKQQSKMMEYGITEEIKTIDETDRKILKSISQNSRKNLVGIARETKTTVDVVRYRLKNLKERGIISGFTIQIDLEKIGYEFYSILIYTSNVDWDLETRMHSFAMQHPNILFVARLIGSWEFEVLFEVKDYTEFEQNLKEFRQQFSSQLRNIEILRLTKEYKYDFFPFKISV